MRCTSVTIEGHARALSICAAVICAPFVCGGEDVFSAAVVVVVVIAACRDHVSVRPDTFIQKTKQRYNSPRSLSTKINLSDMQTEIRLRPPYQLSREDLSSINGFSLQAPSKYKGIGRAARRRRQPHRHPTPTHGTGGGENTCDRRAT